ncbi:MULTISPECIES: hemerythrin domain-containing protein [Nocardiopsis]|uniref:Cation-binding protein n=1 Tax=Nocardiopsis sinuspersici TaxID=501010 RepID=A0A1V3BXJ3_9ACTN|nr:MULTISPECIES: hemerythrin domain-containing protein [Nocardiopsis]OOC53284.1 cation-binding protein [Nocardiopsis sinuspersici]
MTEQRIRAWGGELRAVHHRLRQALELARESVESGARAEAVSRDLRLFCLGFCTALAGHHTSEDASLFPLVVERRPDLAPVVAKLKQDHSMIEYLIGGLERALDAGESDEEKLRHLDGIGAVMESHFRYEESQLVGVLDALDGEDLDRTALFGPIA